MWKSGFKCFFCPTKTQILMIFTYLKLQPANVLSFLPETIKSNIKVVARFLAAALFKSWKRIPPQLNLLGHNNISTCSNEAESYKHTDPGISEDLPSDRNQSLPTDKTSGGGNIQRNTGNVNKWTGTPTQTSIYSQIWKNTLNYHSVLIYCG